MIAASAGAAGAVASSRQKEELATCLRDNLDWTYQQCHSSVYNLSSEMTFTEVKITFLILIMIFISLGLVWIMMQLWKMWKDD